MAFNIPVDLPDPDFKSWNRVHYLLRLVPNRCTNGNTRNAVFPEFRLYFQTFSSHLL